VDREPFKAWTSSGTKSAILPAAIEGIDMSAFNLAVDLKPSHGADHDRAAIPEIRARVVGAPLYRIDVRARGVRSARSTRCASSGGGFVKSLALRLASIKSALNAVCPGPIDTPMLRCSFPARSSRRLEWIRRVGLRKRAHGSVPLGRTACPTRSPMRRCSSSRTKRRS